MESDENVDSDPSILVLVLAVAGSVVTATLLISSAYYAHSNWWYIEYLMARRKTQQVSFKNINNHFM